MPLIQINQNLLNSYKRELAHQNIPVKEQRVYVKCLKYYLDFCHKYNFNHSNINSLPFFIENLHSKKQSSFQEQQAQKAVNIYFSLICGNRQSKQSNQKPGNKSGSGGTVEETPDSYPVKKAVRSLKPERQSTAKPEKRPGDDSIKADSADDLETGQSWQDEFQKLADEINVRHYSPKTLKSYRLWVQKFQTYTRSKSPSLLNVDDVKGFLTHLALEKKVSASSQNLAFNS